MTRSHVGQTKNQLNTCRLFVGLDGKSHARCEDLTFDTDGVGHEVREVPYYNNPQDVGFCKKREQQYSCGRFLDCWFWPGCFRNCRQPENEETFRSDIYTYKVANVKEDNALYEVKTKYDSTQAYFVYAIIVFFVVAFVVTIMLGISRTFARARRP